MGGAFVMVSRLGFDAQYLILNPDGEENIIILISEQRDAFQTIADYLC